MLENPGALLTWVISMLTQPDALPCTHVQFAVGDRNGQAWSHQTRLHMSWLQQGEKLHHLNYYCDTIESFTRQLVL